MEVHSEEEKALNEDELLQVIEALVFAADEPVGADEIAEVVNEVRGEERYDETAIREGIERLNERYEATGRVLRVENWAGGFRLATVHDVAPYLKTFFQHGREKRLSRSLLETLAILAYKQPVTRPEIDFIRGVNSSYAVRKLMEIGLVDVVGRSDALGRPLLYGTTQHFLEEFGLESLEDLPDLREVEELLDDPAFDKERAELVLLKDVRPDLEAEEDSEEKGSKSGGE